MPDMNPANIPVSHAEPISKHNLREGNQNAPTKPMVSIRNHEKLTAHLLITLFHEKALNQVIIALVVTAAFSAALTQMGVSFGWFLVLGFACFAIRRRVEALKDDFIAEFDARRSEMAHERVDGSESVEWINTILESLLPVINTDLFGMLLDLLQETIAKQAPSIVKSVRIPHSKFRIGETPLKLLSFRPIESSPSFPCPDTADQYTTLEVDFMYRKSPYSLIDGKRKSVARFPVFLDVGSKFASVEIPALVAVRGMRGKLHLRIQLLPEPPFVRYVDISFPSPPQLKVNVRPLRTIVDVMNVPLLSSLIERSIDNVLSRFVSPSYYCIDVSRVLMGSDVNLQPASKGVVVCIFHNAQDLDVNPGCQTYAAFSLSRFGRPIGVSRAIPNCNNPHWEDVCVSRVANSQDIGAVDDAVRIYVCDHDDDPTLESFGHVLGFVDTSVKELQSHSNRMVRTTSPLKALDQRLGTRGVLDFSVGFFGFANVPPQRSAEAEASRAGEYSERMRLMLEVKTPPSPEYPSGVLAFQIHQLVGLDLLPNAQSTKPGDLSFCCKIFFNDKEVHRTRSKTGSLSPYINSSYEVFCPDFTQSTAYIAVMYSIDGDACDKLFGAVGVDLQAILEQRSQKSLWLDIQPIAGTGRIRLSVLFKSIAAKLPPSIISSGIATIKLSAIELDDNAYTDANSTVVISAGKFTHSALPISTLIAGHRELQTGMPLSIPVFDRHRTSLIVKICDKVSLSTNAQAVLWLNTLADNQLQTVQMPLHTTDYDGRAINNYIGDPPDAPNGSQIKLTFDIIPGLTSDHLQYASKEKAQQYLDAFAIKTALQIKTPAPAPQVKVPAKTKKSKKPERPMSPLRSAYSSRRSSFSHSSEWSSEESPAVNEPVRRRSVSTDRTVMAGRGKFKGALRRVAHPFSSRKND